jgi:two-component system chemotaxis response regulator CheY
MRFLIIDDSVTMRRIIANILARLGHPDSVHAANGREALDRLATEEIDVVVTDWYMPEMNGLDFVRALRTSPATRHIPIVIVTANAASDDIQQALELGVSSYVLKPFTVETMRDKIASLPPPRSAAAARPLVIPPRETTPAAAPEVELPPLPADADAADATEPPTVSVV